MGYEEELDIGQAESGTRVEWELCVGCKYPGAWNLPAQGSPQSECGIQAAALRTAGAESGPRTGIHGQEATESQLHMLEMMAEVPQPTQSLTKHQPQSQGPGLGGTGWHDEMLGSEQPRPALWERQDIKKVQRRKVINTEVINRGRLLRRGDHE